MAQKEYRELRQKVQAKFDADIAALDRVYAMASGSPAETMPPEAVHGPRPGKRRYTKRGKLSAEEKREKLRAYQRAWREKRRGKLSRNGHENGDDEGLSTKKFNKFLVKGPVSGGGNG